MTVPIDGIILLQYTLMLWRAGAQCQFYCLLHAAFSPSRGMVKKSRLQ